MHEQKSLASFLSHRSSHYIYSYFVVHFVDSIPPKHHHKNKSDLCSLLPSVVYQSLFLRILLKIKIKC